MGYENGGHDVFFCFVTYRVTSRQTDGLTGRRYKRSAATFEFYDYYKFTILQKRRKCFISGHKIIYGFAIQDRQLGA